MRKPWDDAARGMEHVQGSTWREIDTGKLWIWTEASGWMPGMMRARR